MDLKTPWAKCKADSPRKFGMRVNPRQVNVKTIKRILALAAQEWTSITLTKDTNTPKDPTFNVLDNGLK